MGKHLMVREKNLRKAHEAAALLLASLEAVAKDPECSAALLESLKKLTTVAASLNWEISGLMSDESIDVT